MIEELCAKFINELRKEDSILLKKKFSPDGQTSPKFTDIRYAKIDFNGIKEDISKCIDLENGFYFFEKYAIFSSDEVKNGERCVFYASDENCKSGTYSIFTQLDILWVPNIRAELLIFLPSDVNSNLFRYVVENIQYADELSSSDGLVNNICFYNNPNLKKYVTFESVKELVKTH